MDNNPCTRTGRVRALSLRRIALRNRRERPTSRLAEHTVGIQHELVYQLQGQDVAGEVAGVVSDTRSALKKWVCAQYHAFAAQA